MADFHFLDERLAEIRRVGRLRELVPRTQRGPVLIDRQGRQLINFGGNDYLGLAAERAAAATSTGSTASALVCGWSDDHQQLADRIAAFESTEAAVLFPSGFAACSGTVATLAGPRDLILSDELNHASIIDGCRLSPAHRIVFPHRDCETVANILRQQRSQYDQVWLVTDGVFSMDGHLAPLPALCDLAQQFDAVMVVDEAHGTGVLGDGGSGLCEALGVKERVDIRIGTFSKAIGSQGGFVAAPRVVVDYLVNRCRSLIYSTALAPAAVSAAAHAIDVIVQQPQRRARLHHFARRIRHELGFDRAEPDECSVPIIPLRIGDDAAAVAKSRSLADRGFYVPAIRPPTVAEGTARLRITVSAAHDEAMVDALLQAIGS